MGAANQESKILKRGLLGIALFLLATVIAISALTYFVGVVPEDKRPTIIVAALTLLGVLFSASITAVGLLLKDSLDRRALISQREAEMRLKADTALAAVELMTAKGLSAAAAAERREGAILALSSLGYFRLTLLLGERYWKEGTLSCELMMELIDECLKTNDEILHERAANILCSNKERLSSNPSGLDFPSSMYLKWNSSVSHTAKLDLIESLVEALLTKPRIYWESWAINQVLYTLYKIVDSEEEIKFRLTAALLAYQLGRHIPTWKSGFMPPDRHGITYAEIRQKAEEALGLGDLEEQIDDERLRLVLYSKISEADWSLGTKVREWSASP